MMVKVLQKLRNEDNFNLFWDDVTAKAKPFEKDKPKLLRKPGAPKKLEVFHGFVPAKPAHPDEPKGLYRKRTYEAYEHMVNCIKERFNQEDFQKHAMLFQVLLKSATKQPFSVEQEEVMKFFQSNFNAYLLKTQFKVFEENIAEITDVNFTHFV